METVELRYQGDNLTDEELNKELDRLWSQLQDPDSSLSEEAHAAGISESDLEALRGMQRSEVIVVDRDQSGFDPIAAAIIIKIIIPVVGAMAVTVWNKVLVPRIWNEKGDVLKPEK
jgi:hypothetical protein